MTDMTPEQISQALEAGIITPDQAAAMRGKTVDIPASAEAATIGNEENLRFVRGFSDVFIAIGVGLLVMGLSALAALLGGGKAFLGAAVVMALMADYFGRKKRAHLPTLITALAFLLFVQRGAGVVLADMGFARGGILTALITLAAMGLFYLRVRLPFCIALIALSLLYVVYTLLFRLAPGVTDGNIGTLLVLGGAVTFAGALWYDSRDLHRTTRFADNAFWLHFTAAPLIIHGLAMTTVTLRADMLFNLIPVVSFKESDAAILLVIIGLITLVGLAINRRALIVSSLGYAAFAIGFLMKDTGLNFTTIITLTLLMLGGGIVFLGAGWHGARNAMLKVLPRWRVFPPPYDPDFKG